MTKNKNPKLISVLFFVTALAVMILIFTFSAQNSSESSSLSERAADFFARLMFTGYDDMSVDFKATIIQALQRFIRKAAHFSIYCFLGICVFSFIRCFNLSGISQILITMGLCFLYATTDEFHQLFVDGRSGRFTDVLIDSSGAFCGIIIVIVIVSVVDYFRSDNKK